MRRLVWLLVLATLGLSGWAEFHHAAKTLPPGPLLFILAPPGAFPGLTLPQRRGFGLLFQDCLEYGTGMVLEESEAVEGPPREALTVALAHDGDRTRVWVLLRGEGRRDRMAEVSSGQPRQAVKEALEWLGLDGRAALDLLPEDPAAFWDLLALAAGSPEGRPLEALDACGRILDHEPRCGGAWLTHGRLLNILLNADSHVTPAMQDRCEQDFRTALALVPRCPRAASDFSRFRTDAGDHREALDLLFRAIRRNPKAPRLYEATAYAARSAGLLEGAALALGRRDALEGPARGEAGLAENTYLYRGDLDRFETLLGPPGAQADAVRDFYRGYARLLRGDRDGAAALFSRAAEPLEGARQFRMLSRAYNLGLRGDREAALAGLRTLWAERIPVRVPDGEFTFKVAEAFGFLGSPSEAQDVANRAFAQGFACTRWYLQSPFLAQARGTPRWNALEQHLRERQALLEAIYPRERFTF